MLIGIFRDFISRGSFHFYLLCVSYACPLICINLPSVQCCSFLLSFLSIFSNYWMRLRGRIWRILQIKSVGCYPQRPLTKYNTTLSPGFLVQRLSNLQRAALLTSFWRHWFFPNLVDSSWLWWIMRVIFWMNNNFISLFACPQYLLFLPQQLQPNVNDLAAKPQLTDWWEHMCRNVTKTVVSSLNSAGDQQGIAGVWTSTARKYPALKSEGIRTAVRKVTR